MVVSTALSKSLKFKDGKYEEAISWKDDRRMPNTYSTAFKIFENTEQILLKQLKFGEKYCKIIENYVKKGCLEYAMQQKCIL